MRKKVKIFNRALKHNPFPFKYEIMAIGLMLYIGGHYLEGRHVGPFPLHGLLFLAGGLAIVSGSVESLLMAVERLTARTKWNTTTSGTIAEIVATLPEFVVIIFVVMVSPLTAFIIALVTIYNNAIIFSIYSFFLPKSLKGTFVMPIPISKAGREVLIAGSGIALVLGFAMAVFRIEGHSKTSFAWYDLLVIAIIMFAVFVQYLRTLLKYYARAGQEHQKPGKRIPKSIRAISSQFIIGIAGSVAGGESIAAFAEIALDSAGMTRLQTALFLAFFAGVSEYVLVFKAHRRKEFGIALANVFGGITQVTFLVFPFTALIIALGTVSGLTSAAIPIDFTTTLLILLIFPTVYVLFEFIAEDHSLSNLGAISMTGIYTLILFLLIVYGG